jgi:hypothetical protein
MVTEIIPALEITLNALTAPAIPMNVKIASVIPMNVKTAPVMKTNGGRKCRYPRMKPIPAGDATRAAIDNGPLSGRCQ